MAQPKTKPPISEVEERVNRLEDLSASEKQILDESQKRGEIAQYFVRGYFYLLTLIILGIPLYNLYAEQTIQLDLAEILQGYSAIIGPLIGFVIAYYFKTNK